MTMKIERRRFMGAAIAAGAFTIVPRQVLGGAGYVPPSERINLAHIGMGTQGFKDIGELLEDPRIQIVSVCDPNRDSNDYIEWGKGGILRKIRSYLGNNSWRQGETGCPGGRDVGKELVELYYAKNRGTEKFRGCSAYADFRELLAEEKDVDAVKVMTPDHLHAAIAIAAMNAGKHVAMHKPIANRLVEGRKVLDTVRKTGKATHLMAYGSGEANARIVEQINQGVIGNLREVHNWSSRPMWPQYQELPTDRPPVPEGFDWQLWLGPERDRPYHPNYTHTVFRGWYDFGGGPMADMGIYSLWPVFVGLGLESAVQAQAFPTHTCYIANGTSRRRKNDFSHPIACTLRFQFASSEYTNGIELFWYDGGVKPRLPREIESHDIDVTREGILFVGDDGMILGSFHGRNPQLFAKGKRQPLKVDDGPKMPSKRISLWIDECQGGDQSPGSFLNTASITDTVNLGSVALRSGKKIRFDADQVQITNDHGANAYLKRDYREGWEL